MVREIVLAAHEGFYVARTWFDGHDGGLEIIGNDLVLGGAGRFSLLLHGRVERRVDGVAALEQVGIGEAEGVVLGRQKVADIAGKVRIGVDSLAGRIAGQVQILLQRHRLGCIVLLLRDVAGREHAVEHHVAALLAGLRVLLWVEVRRRLGDPHEGGRLGQRELRGVL